ncbi:MAG: hypothetical protein IPJ30_23970 [Acidobacteria bacterium]|nr:hypothetical protein [Acidobacteriota bacterium]
MAISRRRRDFFCSRQKPVRTRRRVFALYGDPVSGLAVLGDVLKTEVWQIARRINERAGREPVPVRIVKNVKGAELAPESIRSGFVAAFELMDPDTASVL